MWTRSRIVIDYESLDLSAFGALIIQRIKQFGSSETLPEFQLLLLATRLCTKELCEQFIDYQSCFNAEMVFDTSPDPGLKADLSKIDFMKIWNLVLKHFTDQKSQNWFEIVSNTSNT